MVGRSPIPDYQFTDALADVIVELQRASRSEVTLIPAGADAQPGCVVLAAAAHALRAGHAALGNRGGAMAALRVWPWALEKFRGPTFSYDAEQAVLNQRRDLVRACALILTAIDTLDEAAAQAAMEGGAA